MLAAPSSSVTNRKSVSLLTGRKPLSGSTKPLAVILCTGGAGIASLSTAQKERMESNRLKALHRRQAKLDSNTALAIPRPPLGWSAAQVPAKPQDLAEIIHKLPEMTLLSTCHPHPRDAHTRSLLLRTHTMSTEWRRTARSPASYTPSVKHSTPARSFTKCGRGVIGPGLAISVLFQ